MFPPPPAKAPFQLAGVGQPGHFAIGSNAVVTVTVSPTTTGNITDTAQVGLSPLETDPVSFNNSASCDRHGRPFGGFGSFRNRVAKHGGCGQQQHLRRNSGQQRAERRHRGSF
jgi:hypothetical protein